MIRVAVVGIGNCASALIQGVQYYRRPKKEIPGLMHVSFASIYLISRFGLDLFG